jgi:hypothetical protein
MAGIDQISCFVSRMIVVSLGICGGEMLVASMIFQDITAADFLGSGLLGCDTV